MTWPSWSGAARATCLSCCSGRTTGAAPAFPPPALLQPVGRKPSTHCGAFGTTCPTANVSWPCRRRARLFDKFYESVLCNVRRWVRHLPAWAAAVEAKGCPLKGCWGFLDGTLVGIARPAFQQRACFSGHKRHHGLKFLSVISPVGVSAFIWGVLPGSRHDAAAFAASGLLADLTWLHAQHPGRPLTTYGDAAFPHSVHVQKGYQGAQAPSRWRRSRKPWRARAAAQRAASPDPGQAARSCCPAHRAQVQMWRLMGGSSTA